MEAGLPYYSSQALPGRYRIKQGVWASKQRGADMYVTRQGEQGIVQHRSERLFRDSDDWFFAIRRGVDQGPFTSEMEARLALREFIEEQLQFERNLAAEL